MYTDFGNIKSCLNQDQINHFIQLIPFTNTRNTVLYHDPVEVKILRTEMFVKFFSKNSTLSNDENSSVLCMRFTTTAFIPALNAHSTPLGVSSKTIQDSGETPSCDAQWR
jgi:hypothetical protein